MKNDCEIVKDLLPNYINGFLNPDTNSFVKEHLSNCADCQEVLENMKNNNERSSEEKVEIDHLKKYRKRMLGVKVFLFTILFIIIVIIITIIIKYNYNNSIMQKVIQNINNYKNSDNYILDVTEHRVNYKPRPDDYVHSITYYYKDGKYKIEHHSKDIDEEIINSDRYEYGEIDSNKKVEIVENDKTAHNQVSNYTYVKKGKFFNTLLYDIDRFDTDFGFFYNIFFRMIYSVRTDRFNGRECYVFKQKDNSGFTEYWIDKENMILIRTIEDDYNNYYREKTYSVIFNTVTDEDVTIPDLQGYTIIDENREVDDVYVDFFNKLNS